MNLKASMELDMDVFFNPEEFGTVATYAGGSINVLFDKEPDEQEESLINVMRCKASDMPSIAHGEPVIVDGNTYKVLNWHNENDMLVVVLNEAV